jgi:ribose 1,5-bisphosphokinase PhnN
MALEFWIRAKFLILGRRLLERGRNNEAGDWSGGEGWE